jgi:hypothetical protein
MLEERTMSPRELAPLLGATLGTTAYHVRTLHQLGLIQLVKTTRVRGAIQHHYRAAERPRVSAEAWDSAPPVAKQALVGATVQQIHDYVSASAAAGGFDRADAHMTRTALKLDAKGRQQLAKAFEKLLSEISRIEGGVGKRKPHELEDVGVVLMLFDAMPFTRRASEDSQGERRGNRRATANNES